MTRWILSAHGLCGCTNQPGFKSSQFKLYRASHTGRVVVELLLFHSVKFLVPVILFSLADALWQIALRRGSGKPISPLSHTFPCYQQTIIHSRLPLCLHPSILCSTGLPGLLWLAVSADEDTPRLFRQLTEPSPSSHVPPFSASVLVSPLHGNSCSNTCSSAFCVSLYFTLAYAGLIISC